MNKTYALIWTGFFIGQLIWSIVKMITIQRENPLVTYRDAAYIVFVRGALSYALSFVGAWAVIFIMPDFMGKAVDLGVSGVQGSEQANGIIKGFVSYTRTASVLFGIGAQGILLSVVFRVSAWAKALNNQKEQL